MILTICFYLVTKSVEAGACLRSATAGKLLLLTTNKVTVGPSQQ